MVSQSDAVETDLAAALDEGFKSRAAVMRITRVKVKVDPNQFSSSVVEAVGLRPTATLSVPISNQRRHVSRPEGVPRGRPASPAPCYTLAAALSLCSLRAKRGITSAGPRRLHDSSINAS